jgi:uncharacterized protein
VHIYLDSAAIIYIVEQVKPYSEALDIRLSADGIVTVTSDLARLECRVKPLREQNTSALEDFDDYFEGAIERMIPLSREVVDLATGFRAEYGFKTPDSLHLAAAVWSQCEAFLTNDHRLDRFRELQVEVVKP